MNKKIFVMVTVLLLAFAASACGTPAAVTVNPQPQIPQLSVDGTGLVHVVPDIAYVYVGVRSEGKTVADALKKNNQSAKDIKDTLMAQAVAEKDIQTSSFNIYPQQYDAAGKVVPTFYVVENTVYVTIRNLDSIGTLLDLIAASGANSINGVYFDLSNKTSAEEQARQLAIAQAKKIAEQVASAAGVKLGRLINVSVWVSSPSFAVEGKGGSDAAAMAGPSVPVSTGQISITASANLAYEIVQ